MGCKAAQGVWDGEATVTQVQITRRRRDPTPAINHYKATIAQVTEIVSGVKYVP